MIQSDPEFANLSVIVDCKNVANKPKESLISEGPPLTHCLCKTEICQCGSKLGVTEANAKSIFTRLGFPDGRDTMISEGYRMDTLHIWGTHDLSTNDILKWLEDYNPKGVEWIDDSSCNVLLNDENTVLRILNKLAEPFDRRIALAAMAAIVSTMDEGDQNEISLLPESTKDLPLGGSTFNLMPPNGRWFKSISSPERAFCIYFRIAHKGDVKLPGAERRSNYYRRYGNPNYGGAVGLLSRSYRRRVKAVTPTPTTTDIRCVNINADLRHLVSYEDIDNDVHGLAMHLQRGSTSGLSKPPRNPPPKWPRRSAPGYSPSSEPTSVFHPPSTVSQSSLNFNFGRVSAKQRLGSRSGAQPLATVTILPEGENGSAEGPLKMLTSFTMVADLEEERAKSRQQLRNDNIFNQPGPSNSCQNSRRRRFQPRGGSSRSGGRGVWSRLG
ncbi:unnamed protein product [Hymenolepis diminuta]|uniref:Nuclear cap-binding protein subunit 3 n=1 Tax=Hymenolepis diminuta TaxID=6216 RepID=A0A0R3STN7_HYMDI|nr:unnamed protein product [Hymenolepis diminuta]